MKRENRLYVSYEENNHTVRNWQGEVIAGPFASYAAAREELGTIKANRATQFENGKKRSKTVFTSDEIPHLWMHKAQEYGRNHGGNLYFREGTIFSYGSHFPIAKHVESGKKKAILFTTRTYSNTTAKHISMVRSAIPSDSVVFHVPNIANGYSPTNHESNLKSYQAEIDNHISTASRARLSSNIEWELEHASSTRQECIDYCKFFKLKTIKLAIVPEVNTEQLAELKRKERKRAAKKAQEMKARRAAEEKERQRVEAERDATRPARIEAWRNGGRYEFHWSENIPTMLRIVGDEVETSRGARFPVEHARKGLALVRAVMTRGEQWRANGHTCHLGHYSIQSIEANGTVHAGCHVVTWPEIERIAPLLT